MIVARKKEEQERYTVETPDQDAVVPRRLPRYGRKVCDDQSSDIADETS